MKLSSFIELSGEQKRSAVLKQGVPLAKWTDCHYTVFLFQLPQFYVETYCCKESRDIHEFRIIYNPSHLSHYLDGICIDELLKE